MWDKLCYAILEDIYQDLLDNPAGILQTTEELNEFLSLSASKEDLICFRNVCERNELYEWCSIVQKKINEIS